MPRDQNAGRGQNVKIDNCPLEWWDSSTSPSQLKLPNSFLLSERAARFIALVETGRVTL